MEKEDIRGCERRGGDEEAENEERRGETEKKKEVRELKCPLASLRQVNVSFVSL